MTLRSRSKQRRPSEKEREACSERATKEFMVWAQGDGKEPLGMVLGRRDWAVLVGVMAYQAADLLASGGDPELIVSIAGDITQALRLDIGAEQAERVITLVAQMTTGVEE